MTDILIWALLFTAIIILVVSVLVLKVIRLFVQESINPTRFATEAEKAEYHLQQEQLEMKKKAKSCIWNTIMGLKPISEEKNLMMDHEFDGIAELDNPTPAWFMVLFYGTMIFAVVYMFSYHVMDWGKLQEDEYAAELQQAEDDRIALLQKPGNKANKINETNVEASTDAAVLQAGGALFKNVCAPCHGEHGQGLVGPNLTDEFWLHGGTIKEIFKTIKYGVPEKGMIAWEKTMNAKQIAEISSYILSIQGSNPAGAKAPQGTKQP
ncbi:cbb3-type cytochrome c oxidase N-terminal domain-containing protein [Pedobacter frigoris]|uniref:cbb3-type cytochrome c oxidase N-terminal domain-containing protein n=1 Tax=Pedobacter frigoris TaxID=2571272 RepID=UPI002931E807|nr:cbb3-type cytochrome c oxidase N-terminal domain-containing protein [Pedobacter frigoris]